MRSLTYLAALLVFSITVSSHREASAASPPAVLMQAAPDVAADASDKKIDAQTIECRRIKVTGSRIKRKRICMTVAQWEEQGRRGRNHATEMQDQGTIDPAGDPVG